MGSQTHKETDRGRRTKSSIGQRSLSYTPSAVDKKKILRQNGLFYYASVQKYNFSRVLKILIGNLYSNRVQRVVCSGLLAHKKVFRLPDCLSE